MKKMIQRMAGVGIYLTGLFVGMVKGDIAKDKFNFKIKSYFSEKQQSKLWNEACDVRLDDIEINTYHTS